MSDPGRQCVMLVGGLGTRLGSLTRDCPKPLLAVDGRPFLEHLVGNIARFGFDDFVLLAGYKAEMVRDFAARVGKRLGVRIRVVAEPEPAGTGGALSNAKEMLADAFLLMNGDSLFDFNLLALAVRPARGKWLGRLALRQVEAAGRYGTVELEGETVCAFVEELEGKGSALINGGVYWLCRKVLDHIGPPPCSLEHEVFPTLASHGLLRAWVWDGPFIDIGVPEDLAWARSHWAAIMRRPAIIFERDGVLNSNDGFTSRIEDFRWMEGAREAIRRCNDAGWFVFVATNQAGVAHASFDEAAVHRLHAWMNEDLRPIGAHIDDFRYCPHHPEAVLPHYAKDCKCRKPAPGMIESLLQDWPVDRKRSVVIGNKPSDVEAAKAVGLTGTCCHGTHLLEFVEREVSSRMTVFRNE